MDDKMTSGEIARKAGVSQKAVRLYDEKGLLKPTDYSEGNYRLYDKEALQVLEKIVALKQIGFSLEEIRDNLKAGEAQDIEEALRMQLAAMEEKRYRIDMVIDAIKRTLARKDEGLDWDDVAGIVQSVTMDQTADLNHWKYVKHNAGEDWYVQVFRSLDFAEGGKVLDLGCGYSKLWRNNWDIIPGGTKIYAYDVCGSWADDFEKFLDENKDKLPQGVDIDLTFADLEKDQAWEKIAKEKTYYRIIMHYVYSELKNPEAVIAKASEVLGKGGYLSVNGPDVASWDLYFRDAMKEAGINAPFIDEKIREQEAKRDAFRAIAGRYFSNIRIVDLPSTFRYESADDIIEKMKDMYDGQAKFFACNGQKLKAYFESKFDENGELLVATFGRFLHCSK